VDLLLPPGRGLSQPAVVAGAVLPGDGFWVPYIFRGKSRIWEILGNSAEKQVLKGKKDSRSGLPDGLFSNQKFQSV
jgi:hypothetical protein